MRVHDFAKVAEERAGFADLDRLVESFASDAHELLAVVIYPTHRVRLVEISVEAWISSQNANGKSVNRQRTIIVQTDVCFVGVRRVCYD